MHNADHQGSDPQLCCDEYYDDKERAELTLNAEEEVVRSTAEESWGRILVMGLKRDGITKIEHQCCSRILTVN